MKSLDLGETKVTDECLRGVKDLKAVTYVNLCGTMIGDTGCEVIGGMSGLMTLDMSYTRITSRGVRALSGNNTIRKLYINNTVVDDEACEYVCKMRSLVRLDICDTQISEDGVAFIRKSLPRCVITP